MTVWVCVVRNQVFVGGESQRCRHSKTCETCNGRQGPGLVVSQSWPTGHWELCPTCGGTGQVSECGEMELIGGEPLEWCRTHDDPRAVCDEVPAWKTKGEPPCDFETQVRVGN